MEVRLPYNKIQKTLISFFSKIMQKNSLKLLQVFLLIIDLDWLYKNNRSAEFVGGESNANLG